MQKNKKKGEMLIELISACAADEMNYTVVINGTLWIGAFLYYVLFAHKWYKGPKHTVDSPSDSATPSPPRTSGELNLAEKA